MHRMCIWSALVASVGFSIVAAAEDYPMAATKAAPAAIGQVSTKTEGPNTKLAVKVDGLTSPSSVDASSRYYVVWAEPLEGGGAPQNLGAIDVGKDTKGELKTATPLTQFQVYVTPEPAAAIPSPSGRQLLVANVVPRPQK